MVEVSRLHGWPAGSPGLSTYSSDFSHQANLGQSCTSEAYRLGLQHALPIRHEMCGLSAALKQQAGMATSYIQPGAHLYRGQLCSPTPQCVQGGTLPSHSAGRCLCRAGAVAALTLAARLPPTSRSADVARVGGGQFTRAVRGSRPGTDQGQLQH